MSQIFAFQSHKVRTLSENSKIWFVAQDVCACLGLKWTGHKLDSIPEGWQKLARYANFSRSLRFISEPAVYKLAFRSNKPEADAFTNWVASEVLPSIRKDGRFEASSKQAELPEPEPAKLATREYEAWHKWLKLRVEYERNRKEQQTISKAFRETTSNLEHELPVDIHGPYMQVDLLCELLWVQAYMAASIGGAITNVVSAMR